MVYGNNLTSCSLNSCQSQDKGGVVSPNSQKQLHKSNYVIWYAQQLEIMSCSMKNIEKKLYCIIYNTLQDGTYSNTETKEYTDGKK